MPEFAYVARDSDGRTRRGTREAPTEASLLERLRADGLFALEVRTGGRADDAAKGLVSYHPLTRWLSPRAIDVELGLRQLATMGKSGLPLLHSLRLCAAGSERASMARVWEDVAARIQAGESLSRGFAAHKVFPRMTVTLTDLGERTGEIDLVLRRAAQALERWRELKRSVVTALAYPAIVVTLAIGTVAYMLVALLPKLSKFLAAFGRKLPPITQFLVDLSAFVQEWFVHGVVAFGILVVVFLVVRSNPRGRIAIDGFALRIPLVGPILVLAGTASFTRNLAVLLASGVRLTESLEVVETMLSNRWMASRVRVVRERVIAGAGFAEPLTQSRAFPPMVGSMVAVGEASGALDEVLTDVADYHEERLAARIRRLAAVLEPLIVIVLGGIVGFVYLAFFLAIYAIAGAR